MGAKMTTQGREDNILGGVPPEVGQSAMQIEWSCHDGWIVNTGIVKAAKVFV
jgi:hypothetical protein